MIWMNARESSAATIKYFTEEAQLDYYSEGQQVIGHWGGKAAFRLGLEGKLKNEDFVALCQNINPLTGENLTPRTRVERTCAYDITFDCPKSVSVMFAWTGDRRLEEGFYQAVRETLTTEIEKEMRTRVRRNGQADGDRLTQEMLWAEFPHFTARPVDGVPDPHMHMHVVVPNATFDPVEQKFKAGQFREIKRRMPYYEAAFHKRLANNLQALGYHIRVAGKAFEIVGVPDTVNQKFSRRTKVIKQAEQDRGITDKDEAAKLGALTREKKDTALTMAELRGIYRAMVTAEEAAALDHFRQPQMREKLGKQELPATNLAGIPGELPPAEIPPPTRTTHHKPTTRSALSLLKDGHKVLSATTTPVVTMDDATMATVAKAAIDRSILHNFYLSSVVSEENILEHALRFAVNTNLPPESFRAAMQQHPDLIFGQIGEQQLVTTQKVLAEEQKNVAWVRTGKGTMAPLVVGHQIKEARLNPGQRAAVHHVLSSTDRVTAIDGRAGTGKTWLMREAVAALETAQHKVLVLAPTSSAVSGTLRREFPAAQTVEQLLVNTKLQEEYRGGVWWVDEAGQLSGPTMHRLFALADKQDARIVVSGDVLQHRAIERGDALRMLYEYAELKPAVVTQIVRQTGQYRQIMEHLTKGEVAEGYRMMDEANLIHELPFQQRYQAIANLYVKETMEGTRPLIVAPAHAEGKLVTDAIREKLKAEGELTGERSVAILKPIHLSPAEKRDYRTYCPGMVVEFITGTSGSPAGTRVVVDAIDYDTGHVYVQKKESATRTAIRNLDLGEYADHIEVFEQDELLLGAGDRIRITKNGPTENGRDRVYNSDQHTVVGFDENGDLKLDHGLVLGKDFAHLNYGFYSTSYAAQSMTVKHVIIAESVESFGAASREQFNVSVGRGQIRPDLFTDDKEELRYAVERSSQRYSALDLVRAAEMQLTAAPSVEMLSEEQTDEFRLAQERAEAQRIRQIEGVPPAPLKEKLGQAHAVPSQGYPEQQRRTEKSVEVRKAPETPVSRPAPRKEKLGAEPADKKPLAAHAAEVGKLAPAQPTTPPTAPPPPLWRWPTPMPEPKPPAWHWPEVMPPPTPEKTTSHTPITPREMEPAAEPNLDDPEEEDLEQRPSLDM